MNTFTRRTMSVSHIDLSVDHQYHPQCSKFCLFIGKYDNAIQPDLTDVDMNFNIRVFRGLSTLTILAVLSFLCVNLGRIVLCM